MTTATEVVKRMLLCILSLFSWNQSGAQLALKLYSDTIPNCKTQSINDNVPEILGFICQKEKSAGTAVVIFPGGAYGFLAIDEEGIAVAREFLKAGISAFVVKYRLPSDQTMRDKSIGPLQDAQRAIKLVRMNAATWNIDSNKVGIIGYSAGGHLASTLGTHYKTSYIPNNENSNLRPDFMILVYPVISMESGLTHRGSRVNLLGENPSLEKVSFFSSEEQVTSNTPPTYLTHTGDDRIVDVKNSIEMYRALLENGVNAELHLYPKGNHGFTQRLPVREWLDPMLMFLKRQGMLRSEKDFE